MTKSIEDFDANRCSSPIDPIDLVMATYIIKGSLTLVLTSDHQMRPESRKEILRILAHTFVVCVDETFHNDHVMVLDLSYDDFNLKQRDDAIRRIESTFITVHEHTTRTIGCFTLGVYKIIDVRNGVFSILHEGIAEHEASLFETADSDDDE